MRCEKTVIQEEKELEMKINLVMEIIKALRFAEEQLSAIAANTKHPIRKKRALNALEKAKALHRKLILADFDELPEITQIYKYLVRPDNRYRTCLIYLGLNRYTFKGRGTNIIYCIKVECKAKNITANYTTYLTPTTTKIFEMR